MAAIAIAAGAAAVGGASGAAWRAAGGGAGGGAAGEGAAGGGGGGAGACVHLPDSRMATPTRDRMWAGEPRHIGLFQGLGVCGGKP